MSPIQQSQRKFKNRKLFIAIEGGIGVGKTTFATWLGEQLNYEVYYEPLDGDIKDYREAFYANKEKYAFSFQIKLFQKRFIQHLDIVAHASERGAVQDRSIYGDQIFANMLFDAGYIDELEIGAYDDTWEMMRRFLVYPDLMIYLDSPLEAQLERIKTRNRPGEEGITKEYLEAYSKQHIINFNKMREIVPCSMYNWKDPNVNKYIVLDNIKKLEQRINFQNNTYIKTV